LTPGKTLAAATEARFGDHVVGIAILFTREAGHQTEFTYCTTTISHPWIVNVDDECGWGEESTQDEREWPGTRPITFVTHVHNALEKHPEAYSCTATSLPLFQSSMNMIYEAELGSER